jgi:hypothetical protein
VLDVNVGQWQDIWNECFTIAILLKLRLSYSYYFLQYFAFWFIA